MHLYFWVIGFFCFFETGYANVVLLPRNKFANVSVVGGTPATAGEFPNLVVMRYDGKLRCGGTLIGKSHVLTAAHCVYGFSAAQAKALSVMTNTLDLNGGANAATRSVRKIVIHERYNPNSQNNDVAVLVLNSPIQNVKLVSLPKATLVPKPTTKPTTKPSSVSATATTKPTTKPPAGDVSASPTIKTTTKKPATSTLKAPALGSCYCTCDPGATTKKPSTRKPASFRNANAVFSTYANAPALVAGWGTTSSGGSISQVLLKADVQILPNSVCINQYGSSEFIGANMLCAAAPGKDTCQGDSGGPIFVEGIQVGITSWGYGCAEPEYAGVYTRVSTYVPWIQTTVARNPAPATTSG